ncbi:hypothetical protein Hanom_Chr02g00147251 [Helianthus anomalus]
MYFFLCSLEGCTPFSEHDSQTSTCFSTSGSDTKCWLRPLTNTQSNSRTKIY